jgi:hypothetical protein
MTKPTRGIKRLLDRMGDKPLIRIKDEKGRWIFTFVDSTNAHARTVNAAIKGGFIVPSNDALFDSKQSQTWRKA